MVFRGQGERGVHDKLQKGRAAMTGATPGRVKGATIEIRGNARLQLMEEVPIHKIQGCRVREADFQGSDKACCDQGCSRA